MIKGIVYILVLMMIFLGVVLHQSDLEYREERNIFNYTENQFKWNSSQWQKDPINSTNVTMSDAFSHRVRNIVFKTVDLVGYSAFQIIKVSMEFGYEKAYAYEPEKFITIAKIILIIAILGFIVPIIVPVLALIYLLFEGIKWVIQKWQK